MAHSTSQRLPKANSVSSRTPRSKTIFQIAQPPPGKKSRIRRPRILLQLQQLSDTNRPIPVLDVLPSSCFAPRLAQRFPKIFKGKDALGPSDVIVTNSNSSAGVFKVGEDSGLSSDDEASDSREVVGTICRQTRKPQEDIASASVEICLDQGLVWKATPLPRGGYEFNAKGADGSPLQARWVRRDRRQRRISSPPDAASQAAKRFTFSIVNPSARRHPVIASMTTESIEVYDQYPAAVPQNTPQLAPTSPSSILSNETSYFDIQDLISQPKEPLIHTDHHLRSLIVITGIYVSLEEGWAQDAPRSQQRRREHERDPISPVESRATIAKLSRASTQIFHRRSAVLPDETHVEEISTTIDRPHSARAASTESGNTQSLSTQIRRGKEDRKAILTCDGVNDCSDDSSRPSSQGLPLYPKPRNSSELPFEKSELAKNDVAIEEASTVVSASRRSTRMSELKGRSGQSMTGFRRFFSLPCIRSTSSTQSKVKREASGPCMIDVKGSPAV
jgi:hypothetical protein